MELIKFKSEEPKTAFAPIWDYSIGEDFLIKDSTYWSDIKNIVLQGLNQIDICSNKNPLKNYQITGLYYPVLNSKIPLEEIRKLNPTIEINQIEHNQILNEEQEFNSEQIKKYNDGNSPNDDIFQNKHMI